MTCSASRRRFAAAPSLWLAVAALLSSAAPVTAAAPARNFEVARPGSMNAAGLPRELARPPVCTELPKYPRQAYRKGLEGLTVVRATVGTDGRIKVLTLYHASGDTPLHREMDDAVAAAVASCAWEVVSPASFDKPVDLDVHYRWVKAEHADDF